MVPHMGHMDLLATVVVISVGVHMQLLAKEAKEMLNSNCLVISSHIYAIGLELTFAGLQTFKPPVFDISVDATSTVLKPSTTRSAATNSARFLECAAL